MIAIVLSNNMREIGCVVTLIPEEDMKMNPCAFAHTHLANILASFKDIRPSVNMILLLNEQLMMRETVFGVRGGFSLHTDDQYALFRFYLDGYTKESLFDDICYILSLERSMRRFINPADPILRLMRDCSSHYDEQKILETFNLTGLTRNHVISLIPEYMRKITPRAPGSLFL
jgi:hypothetical protein